MNEDTYLKNRVDDQIDWLDNKSSFNQKSYKRSRLVIIALSVMIPFLTGYIDEFGLPLKIAVGLSGVIIAFLEGFVNLSKHQENWVQYRAAAEALKQEKMIYLTKSGTYAGSEAPFQAFVENIESILASENKIWQKNTSQRAKLKV